ncbi:glycosyltransferase family 2 protein [Nitrospira sp. BLG_2]|uniref:glycosyltransferase family 2 protein n=1 Tax=Nitrospira sp. BLG_2 TaxID=3397507 RepID=UPI003B9AB71F
MPRCLEIRDDIAGISVANHLRPMNAQETKGAMPHICVCICTFKRPGMLRRLLEKLEEQDSQGCFSFSVVIVDNDQAESARSVVESFTIGSSFQVRYCVEPRQNIALARNKAIENASGDFIAFIDDDEFPTSEWLRRLFNACKQHEVAGVLGPVNPYFEHEPPGWVRQGRFFERPTYPTGYRIGMWEARTGNVLFRRNILADVREPFRAEFGTAGEDIDFFRRMMAKGNVFIWCNEAAVFEVVPPERCTKKYLLRKALLRGSNFLKHPTDRAKNFAKSIVAVPLYGMTLPVMFLAGSHHFVRTLIKFCDHAGRLLAVIGLNPVKERDH